IAFVSSSGQAPPAQPTPPPATPTTPEAPTQNPAPGLVPVPNVALFDTAYPIPSGALYVSPSGNDSHNGSAASPFRTVQRAVNAAPAGATIVLRQGEYREKVTITNKRLTLQPYPHEQVWLKGSDVVTGWVQ